MSTPSSIMSQTPNPTSDLQECEKCNDALHAILDNQATPEEKAFLETHIESCAACFEQYEVEKQIRATIKEKLINRVIPIDLKEAIRSKVFESTS